MSGWILVFRQVFQVFKGAPFDFEEVIQTQTFNICYVNE